MVAQVGIGAVAVNPEFPGDAFAAGQPGFRDSPVHGVFGHEAVGGPLAAGDRHQPVVRYDDLVAARQLLGALALLFGCCQRPLAREDGEYVAVGRGGVHVESRRGEDEVDLLPERPGLLLGFRADDVGRADDDLVVPRHGEQHAPVGGLGNHDGVIAPEEFPVQHEVHALARRHHRAVVGAVHVHYVVHEAPGGIHHAAGLHLAALAREVVGEADTRHAACVIVQNPRHGGLVEDRAAMFDAGLCEVYGHARVVELPVVVDHAALQPLLHRRGKVFPHLLRRDEFRTSVTETERKQVVEREPAEVEHVVPMAVIRDDECLVLDQMRCVGLHAAALAQRLEHEQHVALLEVAHAAVHEFGRTARSALGEVALFEARDAQAACRGVHCHAQSRRAAAYDDHVPYLVSVGEFSDLRSSFHTSV